MNYYVKGEADIRIFVEDINRECEKVREYMNKEIKNSKLVSFSYSGHGLFYDEKDKVNKEIENFILS